MSESGTAWITKIQKFCTHDGPGIRTTVFFKGCPLRCAWCHNPETQSMRPQVFYNANLCVCCGACAAVCPQGCHLVKEKEHRYASRQRCEACLRCVNACPTGALEVSGEEKRIAQILDIVEQDRAFYGRSGGLTLSGGEPMAQPEAALALLRGAKARGIHTALETCGMFSEKWLPGLAAVTDLFLWDFKDSDPARHLIYTGATHEKILDNLHTLDALEGTKILLRCILVKGVNLDEKHLQAIKELYHRLRHAVGVELLPYHPYGGGKSVALGERDSARPEWIPNSEELRRAVAFLRAEGVKCICQKKI